MLPLVAVYCCNRSYCLHWYYSQLPKTLYWRKLIKKLWPISSSSGVNVVSTTAKWIPWMLSLNVRYQFFSLRLPILISCETARTLKSDKRQEKFIIEYYGRYCMYNIFLNRNKRVRKFNVSIFASSSS